MVNFSNDSLYDNETVRSAFNFEMPLDIILYGSIFYAFIFIVGVTGNLLVIYVLTKEKELRNFTNYLLANLSIADLMVLFICVPSALHDLFAKERWYLGKLMCYSIVFFENCMSLASILTIFMITIERYYVICKPLKVKSIMTQSHTLKIILFIWLLSIIVNLPFIFLAEYKLTLFFDNNKQEYKCSSVAGNKWTIIYSVTVTFIVFVIIGIILSWMFHKISESLKKSTKAFMNPIQISSNLQRYQSQAQNHKNILKNVENSISKNEADTELIPLSTNEKTPFNKLKTLDSVTCTSSFNSFKKKEGTILNINHDIEKYIKPRRQLIRMLMCVIIVFYICFFPLKMWVFILMCFGSQTWFLRIIQFKQYWYVSITCRIFFYANSSLNPILYNCLSKKFRHSFKRLCLFKIFFKKNFSEETTCEYKSKTHSNIAEVSRELNRQNHHN